ncbi:MAG TPA: flagellar basal body rod protein FlgB [Candidatus Acidoferrum sp.]|nr:flagellar basal body rod protein FlgB [Candidatus Acidoferrum sp.]
MADISFGATVGMLKNAMDGASSTHSALANNIANVNTPNFRRTDVSFKEALAATDAGASPNPDELPLVITNDRDIASGTIQPGQPFTVTSTVDDTTQMRIDGSNVDIDQEMAKLSLNSGYADTMAQLLYNEYGRIHRAIQEQA